MISYESIEIATLKRLAFRWEKLGNASIASRPHEGSGAAAHKDYGERIGEMAARRECAAELNKLIDLLQIKA